MLIYGTEFSPGKPMFVVRCPECAKLTEIAPDAVGPDRTDLWNVVVCDYSPASFSYDDEDVFEVPDSDDPNAGRLASNGS